MGLLVEIDQNYPNAVSVVTMFFYLMLGSKLQMYDLCYNCSLILTISSMLAFCKNGYRPTYKCSWQPRLLSSRWGGCLNGVQWGAAYGRPYLVRRGVGPGNGMGVKYPIVKKSPRRGSLNGNALLKGCHWVLGSTHYIFRFLFARYLFNIPILILLLM